MTVPFHRATPSPRPWLTAGRILLVASAEMFIHGVTGHGRPARLSPHTGKVVRE